VTQGISQAQATSVAAARVASHSDYRAMLVEMGQPICYTPLSVPRGAPICLCASRDCGNDSEEITRVTTAIVAADARYTERTSQDNN
jgi:hypothetical protein